MAALEFLTPQWLQAYESTVRDAAVGEDLSGVEFSMCEILKNAPPHLRRGRGADAHIGFRLANGRFEFPNEPWDDANFTLIADFESIAPWLNLPAEQTKAAGIMERLHAAGKLRFAGKLTDAPRFVLTLHDRLAEITAPYVGTPYWEA
jgi:hypothetical protein